MKLDKPNTAYSGHRLPAYARHNWQLREGTLFRVTGSRSRWRFIAYVIPATGNGYIEAKEIRRGNERASVRCIDPDKVTKVET